MKFEFVESKTKKNRLTLANPKKEFDSINLLVFLTKQLIDWFLYKLLYFVVNLRNIYSQIKQIC